MSLSELWSLYGQNYIDALLATWGMTLEIGRASCRERV